MYHRLYIEFFYFFNIERDYYECHEVMEEYWMSEGKNRLLQALLQVAVGLHHFRNSNVGGAIKLLEQAMEKHGEHWDGALGIDKQGLFTDVKAYLERLYHYEDHPFPFYDLTIAITDSQLLEKVVHCIPEGVADEDKY